MQGNAESQPAEIKVPAPPTHRMISGFWRRLIAIIIDSLILFFIGFTSGLFLFDFFTHLGAWGCLVGLCVALVYFGLLNSTIGKGQTIGKWIMEIEVIDKTGTHISLGRSCLRYAILGAPFFLNHSLIPPTIILSPIGYVIFFIVLGLGGAIIYLSIFNRRTRQSVHDLAVGTFVVKISPKGSAPLISLRKLHLAVIGAWLLMVIGFSSLPLILFQKEFFSEILAVQKAIQSTGKVHMATVSVSVGKSWKLWESKGGEKYETTDFKSEAFWKTRPDDYEAAAKEIAFIILNEYPDIMKKDVLSVTVTYGYDIGIARRWEKQSFQHSPQEWHKILGKTKPGSDV